MSPAPAARRRPLPGSPFAPTSTPSLPWEPLQVDDRVTHDRYGMGTVVRVEGPSAVLVNFGGVAVRRLAVPSPKLTKL